jgi:colanic acid/amylovoran biosynthesis glycosyltransferase
VGRRNFPDGHLGRVITVAYLANQFPAAVEPYVGEEIGELRRRGVRVIAGSVRKSESGYSGKCQALPEHDVLCLESMQALVVLRAFALLLERWRRIAVLVRRIFFEGRESLKQRVKALLHTWLGACYAVKLKRYGVDHIHVHHGYFGAWIAMTAARLLGVSYSMTLHGSDLLLHGVYLDAKLKHCQNCFTVSEYNRSYIAGHFPEIDAHKVQVTRMGVDLAEASASSRTWTADEDDGLKLLAVGRLHEVKNHAFLVLACVRLRELGIDFKCAIAGDGPKRPQLEKLIHEHDMQGQVKLLGHVDRAEVDELYSWSDIVVLTSRSEGIPLVLMEAMVRGRIVVAPAITGIPELVLAGKTGFLYSPGKMADFTERISFVSELMRSRRAAFSRLDWIRHAARVQVVHNFNRSKNLAQFSDQFLELISAA